MGDKLWEKAACRQLVDDADPEDRQYVANLWWPVQADCEGPDATAAKRVCRGCPIRRMCLEYALDRGERFGIWGGWTPAQRRRLTTVRELSGAGVLSDLEWEALIEAAREGVTV